MASGGGGVERGLGEERGQRFGQRAPVGRLDGHSFDGRRLDAIQDVREGLIDG